VTFDAAGSLYGTTAAYGKFGWGAVYKLKPNSDGTWTETVIHSFVAQRNSEPLSGVIIDAAPDQSHPQSQFVPSRQSPGCHPHSEFLPRVGYGSVLADSL